MATDTASAAQILLPCPFCGCAPTTIERPDNIDGTQFFYAIACYCGHHSACAHKMAVRKTPEIAKADAIAAWNTRTPQPTQAQAGANGKAVHQFRKKGLTPMGHETSKALVRKYGNDPLHLVLQVERHHGIKGGQHGTE